MRLFLAIFYALYIIMPWQVFAATVISSLPYDISSGGDYELSGSLSSATYGIEVGASNVNIDAEFRYLVFVS